MTGILAWFLSIVLFHPEEREMSEQLASGYVGNFYGPTATEARREGRMPPIVMTPHMGAGTDGAVRCCAMATSFSAGVMPASCTAISR